MVNCVALFSSSLSNSKILIVDDAIDNLRFLANILTKQGYQVRKVLNGHMALTAAKSSPPDLVLLDINMPQMNGYEVCQALKADPATADIPVIFISALDDVLDRVRAYTVGGVDYIAKPFQYEEVIARVTTQLRLKVLTQEVAAKTEQAASVQANYQQLFDHMSQGVYQLRLDGTYHQVNPAFATLLGYPSTAALMEEIGNTPQDLYVDPERWLNLMESVNEGQLATGWVSELYRADGVVITVSESLYPLRKQIEQLEAAPAYLGLVAPVAEKVC